LANKEISQGTDWLLGDFSVEPPVPVVDTDFHSWEPDENGRYPVQALHYSVMHPYVLAHDDDLKYDRARPESSVGANNRSLLFTYLRVARASMVNVVDQDGNQQPPIPVQIVDEPSTYGGGKFSLDTVGLREDSSKFYKRIGGVTLKWEGEPPFIPCPVENSLFFPDSEDTQSDLE
jgi:hypothetical protein